MKKWKVWLAVILIFLSGVCTGTVGTGLVIRHKLTSMASEGSPAIGRIISTVLSHRLQLNADQQILVSKSVQQTQARLAALRHQYTPQAKQIIDEGITDVKKNLSLEQQAELDRLRTKMMNRFSRFQGQ